MKTINLADVAITERSDRKDDVGCRAGAQPVLSGNIARRICLSARRSWSRIPPSSWSILSRPSSERVIAAFLTVRPLCPPIFGMKLRRTSHDENAIGSVLAADAKLSIWTRIISRPFAVLPMFTRPLGCHEAEQDNRYDTLPAERATSLHSGGKDFWI